MIDSEIDATHPDLEGAVVERYNATGVEEKPHSHGTGMAGAIASHRRLLGTAPGARLLAIRAFSTEAASAQSTTFNILKGLDYARQQRSAHRQHELRRPARPHHRACAQGGL